MIQKIYQALEKKKDFSCLTSNFLKEMSDVDIFIRDMERCVFFENIEAIKKHLEYYLTENSQSVIDYYQLRFEQTNNPILKARYSYVLSKLAPSKKWVNNALKFLEISLKATKNNESNPLDVLKPIRGLIDLAVHNKNIEYINIEKFIYNVLDVSNFKIQTVIISCEPRIFKNKVIIVNVLQTCKKLLKELDCYYGENLCKAAIDYSSKIQNEEVKKYFLEKAGDIQLKMMELRKGDALVNEYYLKMALSYYLKTNN